MSGPHNLNLIDIHSRQVQAERRGCCAWLHEDTVYRIWGTVFEQVFGHQAGLPDIVVPDRLNIRHEVYFLYEKRKCHGKQLHLACLSMYNVQLVTMLLRLGANLQEGCECIGWSHTSVLLPIHIAAGQGNVQIVNVLLQSNADINSVSHLDNKPHFTALHECTYFNQYEMATNLIEAKANIEIGDSAGASPLHWAARRGAAEILELLVSSNADIDKQASIFRTVTLSNLEELPSATYTLCCKCRDTKQKYRLELASPLQWALQFGRLPHRSLRFVTNKTMRDLRKICQESRRAAHRMLVDDDNQLRPGWTEGLCASQQDSLTTKYWVEILAKAPMVAEAILEAVTVTPNVQSNTDYPLPARALIHGIMNCNYAPSCEWKLEGDLEMCAPLWHFDLAPQERPFRFELETWHVGKLDWSKVRIKILMLPDIIDHCEPVLHALEMTTHLRIFAKLGIQAIIEQVWQVGYRFFYDYLTYRSLEIAVYMFVCMTEDRFKDVDFCYRFSWGIAFVSAYREFLYEMIEFSRYLWTLNQCGAYVYRLRSLFDVCSNVLAQVLVISTYAEYRLVSQLDMLAILTIIRWLQLLFAFRIHPWFGKQVSAMWRSFLGMGSFLFIMLLGFCGFFHAWMILELGQSQRVFWQVFVGTFRLLAIGDGDGVDMVLGLNESDETEGSHITRFFLLLSVLVFCICILNLFIAVNGEAYEDAQDIVHATFLQDRAGVCLEAIFRVRLPFLVAHPVTWSVHLRLTGLGIWCCLLLKEDLHPIVPSLMVLLPFVLFGDAVLMQLPWKKSLLGGYTPYFTEPSPPSFLWICHRSDFNEADYYPDIEPITKAYSDPFDGRKDSIPGRADIYNPAPKLRGQQAWSRAATRMVEKHMEKILSGIREPAAAAPTEVEEKGEDKLLSTSRNLKTSFSAKHLENKFDRDPQLHQLSTPAPPEVEKPAPPEVDKPAPREVDKPPEVDNPAPREVDKPAPPGSSTVVPAPIEVDKPALGEPEALGSLKQQLSEPGFLVAGIEMDTSERTSELSRMQKHLDSVEEATDIH